MKNLQMESFKSLGFWKAARMVWQEKPNARDTAESTSRRIRDLEAKQLETGKELDALKSSVPKQAMDMGDLVGTPDYLNLHEDFLRNLALNPHENTRVVAAQNPETPPDVLLVLARDDSEWVRSEVAENPSTPFEMLKELAKDDQTRAHVVMNPTLPLDMLESFVQEAERKGDINDIEIIINALSNPDIPVHYLEHFAKDHRYAMYGVHVSIARNQATPTYVLEELYKVNHGLYDIANHPNTPQNISREIFVKLSTDTDDEMRHSVALGRRCPVDILVKLSTDSVPRVRMAVTQNGNTPKEILVKLASNDPDETVRRVAKGWLKIRRY